jgi:hypothetical protein
VSPRISITIKKADNGYDFLADHQTSAWVKSKNDGCLSAGDIEAV